MFLAGLGLGFLLQRVAPLTFAAQGQPLPRWLGGLLALGSAALALTYVACGRFDAYIERGIRLWDIAAGGFIVERAGELVTREEIAECLWDKNVFVDIELGINTAARKVRAALHDNPDMPRYIRTVVGRGYQFIAPTIVEIQRPGQPNARLFTAEELGQALLSAALSAAPK